MKLLLLILLLPCITNAQIVRTSHIPDTLEVLPPDPSWASLVWNGGDRVPFVEITKYDTLGPILRLVSDTAHDHWNGVSAMWVYEVGKYYTRQQVIHEMLQDYEVFRHISWLDSKKKPLTLKVWEDKQ